MSNRTLSDIQKGQNMQDILDIIQNTMHNLDNLSIDIAGQDNVSNKEKVYEILYISKVQEKLFRVWDSVRKDNNL